MESRDRNRQNFLVVTKEDRLFVFNCDNGHLDPVGSGVLGSVITSHSCRGSRIALTCGRKVIIMNMTIEDGAVEEQSWGIDGEGTSVTWCDEASISVVTKGCSVVGYSSFSSTPVEDFRVETGNQEIVNAVKTKNRLFVLASTGDVFATKISPFPTTLQEICRIEEGVTNILQCDRGNLMIFKNGQLLGRESNQDGFSKVLGGFARCSVHWAAIYATNYSIFLAALSSLVVGWSVGWLVGRAPL